MFKLIKYIFLLAIVAIIGWFFYSPYWTAHQMQKAANAHDVAELSKYIDYPEVRQNITTDLMNKINSQASESAQSFQNGPLGGVYNSVAGAIVDKAVQILISPETISFFLANNNANKTDTSLNENQAASEEIQTTTPEENKNFPSDFGQTNDYEIKMGYEDLNNFAITINKKNNPNSFIRFILGRQNVFSWRLISIKANDLLSN